MNQNNNKLYRIYLDLIKKSNGTEKECERESERRKTSLERGDCSKKKRNDRSIISELVKDVKVKESHISHRKVFTRHSLYRVDENIAVDSSNSIRTGVEMLRPQP